ncbi:MAG: XisI protein [Prochloraceae cyanobacterium]|nr:XisI protein [Prochloraceae cyanobacterium]
MDTLKLSPSEVQAYRETIQTLLEEYAEIVYLNGQISNQLIIDATENNYLVMSNGWDEQERVYHCLISIEIKGDKIWIQHDRTEDGIASELVAAGIPKTQIVLGFLPPERRKNYSL